LIGNKNKSSKSVNDNVSEEEELLFQQELDKLNFFDFSMLNSDSLEKTNISLPLLLEGSHTPRYEDSSGSIATFLKDIAGSPGFQSAFLGDLIKSFGSLDSNALKLIYSLLIKPLNEAKPSEKSKQDRVGLAPSSFQSPQRISRPQNLGDNIVLENDRLPLRDQPENGWDIFPSRRPWDMKKVSELQPSSLHSVNVVSRGRPSTPPQISSYEDTWLPRPQKLPRLRANARRDDGVDVITAPPFENFEIVLGSSLDHSPKQKQIGPVPFHKLKLGEAMPPPEALEALPDGAVLIPPSQLFKRPPLPKITTGEDGTPRIEMPLSDLMPNLPFFGKNEKRPPGPSSWLRPPAPPKASDIPPRIPSFLPSMMQTRRPSNPNSSPNRRTGPNIQLPYFPSSPTRLHNPPPPRLHNTPPPRLHNTPPPRLHNTPPPRLHNTPPPRLHNTPPSRLRPTGPPPAVTKLQESTTPIPVNNNALESSNNIPNVKPIMNPIMNPSGIDISGPIPVPVFMPAPQRPVIVSTTMASINNEVERVDEIMKLEPEYSQNGPPVNNYPAQPSNDQHQAGTPSPQHDENSYYSEDDQMLPTSTQATHVTDNNEDFPTTNDRFVPGFPGGFNEFHEDSMYYHDIPQEYAYYDDTYYDGRETQYYYDTGSHPQYDYDQNPTNHYQYNIGKNNSHEYAH
ncbi:unnamed protein product, partial [Meganyctiphanes norvegica]